MTAHITVARPGSTTILAEVDSAPDGTFTIDIEPGVYTLTAGVDEYLPTPQSQDITVTVSPDSYVHVTITFDSGIRSPVPQ